MQNLSGFFGPWSSKDTPEEIKQIWDESPPAPKVKERYQAYPEDFRFFVRLLQNEPKSIARVAHQEKELSESKEVLLPETFTSPIDFILLAKMYEASPQMRGQQIKGCAASLMVFCDTFGFKSHIFKVKQFSLNDNYRRVILKEDNKNLHKQEQRILRELNIHARHIIDQMQSREGLQTLMTTILEQRVRPVDLTSEEMQLIQQTIHEFYACVDVVPQVISIFARMDDFPENKESANLVYISHLCQSVQDLVKQYLPERFSDFFDNREYLKYESEISEKIRERDQLNHALDETKKLYSPLKKENDQLSEEIRELGKRIKKSVQPVHSRLVHQWKRQHRHHSIQQLNNYLDDLESDTDWFPEPAKVMWSQFRGIQKRRKEISAAWEHLVTKENELSNKQAKLNFNIECTERKDLQHRFDYLRSVTQHLIPALIACVAEDRQQNSVRFTR